jgi:hypothetical protein
MQGSGIAYYLIRGFGMRLRDVFKTLFFTPSQQSELSAEETVFLLFLIKAFN